jgi:hypothetical protein
MKNMYPFTPKVDEDMAMQATLLTYLRVKKIRRARGRP